VVESLSTVVTLSDEAKTMKAATDWLMRSKRAIVEKAHIELAQWDHAVRTAGTDDQSTLYAKFANAGEAEKEAYVQRKLIKYDASIAMHAISRKFQELTAHPISKDLSDDELVSRRDQLESIWRDDVITWSKGPIVHNPSAPHPSNVQQNEQGVAPVERVKPTVESIAAAQRARLEQQRQAMGAGTGTASDPAVKKYALAIPGTAERLVEAEQRIDKVQSEFGALAEIWKKAAERGEKWALPHVPDPSADNTGVNTFRYEENHETYAPNIASLSLKVAKWSLGIMENAIGNPLYAGTRLHSRYGDQVITDYADYVIAAKDYISKLELAAVSPAIDATNGASSTSE
jgi:hypothetical protein